eukprot:Opistho-2@11274
MSLTSEDICVPFPPRFDAPDVSITLSRDGIASSSQSISESADTLRPADSSTSLSGRSLVLQRMPVPGRRLRSISIGSYPVASSTPLLSPCRPTPLLLPGDGEEPFLNVHPATPIVQDKPSSDHPLFASSLSPRRKTSVSASSVSLSTNSAAAAASSDTVLNLSQLSPRRGCASQNALTGSTDSGFSSSTASGLYSSGGVYASGLSTCSTQLASNSHSSISTRRSSIESTQQNIMTARSAQSLSLFNSYGASRRVSTSQMDRTTSELLQQLLPAGTAFDAPTRKSSQGSSPSQSTSLLSSPRRSMMTEDGVTITSLSSGPSRSPSFTPSMAPEFFPSETHEAWMAREGCGNGNNRDCPPSPPQRGTARFSLGALPPLSPRRGSN